MYFRERKPHRKKMSQITESKKRILRFFADAWASKGESCEKYVNETVDSWISSVRMESEISYESNQTFYAIDQNPHKYNIQYNILFRIWQSQFEKIHGKNAQKCVFVRFLKVLSHNLKSNHGTGCRCRQGATEFTSVFDTYVGIA